MMKNFLAQWMKRSSREKFYRELATEIESPEFKLEPSNTPACDTGVGVEQKSVERNSVTTHVIHEPVDQYVLESEGKVPRKKMDENLYRALSG